MFSHLFLKDKKTFFSPEAGISLTEVLVVVAILALLIILVLTGLKPNVQLSKGRDARRKADLVKLKNLLEAYYNDKDCYPESLAALVPSYTSELPKDPTTRQSYDYFSSPDNCDAYWIYARLEYEADPDIEKVGCEDGCGPGGGTEGGSCGYNYGICSTATILEACGEEGGAYLGVGLYYACQGSNCNVVGLVPPTCTGDGKYYYKVSCSGSSCCDNECGTCEACCTDCDGICP